VECLLDGYLSVVDIADSDLDVIHTFYAMLQL